MKIHTEFQQHSLSWLCARSGIPTASEFKNLVTPQWKVRTGKEPNTYLAFKLAEKWFDGPLPGFSSWATEQGQVSEMRAIDWLACDLNTTVEQVGFVTNDSGTCGCSPDGMIDGIGVEIKSLQPTNHVKCLLGGIVPEEFTVQVQFSLFVTQSPKWMFFAFHNRLPKLLLTIEPIPKAQKAIAEAMDRFQAGFDAAFERLCKLNGGPPPKRQPMTFSAGL